MAKENTTVSSSSARSQKGHQHRGSNKGAQSTVGGTAIPGAKSTQPRAISEASNPQQQQYDSYNRDMRRRMDRMGQNDPKATQPAQNQRQKRMNRLKERREQQLAQIKKSLPGGKVDTSTRRVYYMIAAVAVLVILVIAIFVVLRMNGMLH